MPPKKRISSTAIEQDEFRVFDPSNIKQTTEVPVKEKPSIEELTTIEKPGKKIARKKATKRTTKKTTRKKATKKSSTTSKFSKATPAEFKPTKLKKNGYILVVTEKPQAAGKIAAALAEGKDKKLGQKIPYYELTRNGKPIVVACAVGHLFTVSQTVKGTGYPIFDIAWFQNGEVRKKDFTKQYYLQLKRLVKDASEIVIATDFDIEGEVIGYNVMRFIAQQEDAKRMKFSSLTAGEIQKAYDNALPTIEWGQAIAGETRHFLDWLYGINLSRALMSSIKSIGKFRVMSIGRVQGPTLKLIVDKEKIIRAFKPTPYWQVFLTVNDGKNKLEVKHNRDITKKEELEKFKELEGKRAKATTKKTKQVIRPPAPFDLTTLQTEAYKFHGLTPARTLQIAQKLYLAGLISYPRTSSQKIPEETEPLKILKQLSSHFTETKHATRKKPIEGNKTDPAHPAITPTGVYQALDGQDEKIYELIVKRFISCFCDDTHIENKRVEVIIDNLKFAEKGLEIKKPGWMNVYPTKTQEKEIKDMDGEVTIEKVNIEEKETKPPKRFTPASIVTELEKRNLGTKATRANIIETLYDRNYVKDKSIKATELGMRLIDSLQKHSPIIINEQLTREIEKDMANIRNSKKDLEKKEKVIIQKAEKALTDISKDFHKKEKEIGKELVAATEAGWAQEKEANKLLPCPLCKKGMLTIKYTPRFKSYFVACTEYPECKQTFSLPQGLIKKTEKICEECGYPMLLRIKQGKRPWQFCFNPKCPSRLELDIDGNTKKEKPRYTGKSTEIKNKKKPEKII